MNSAFVAGLAIRGHAQDREPVTLDPRQIIAAMARRRAREEGSAGKTPPWTRAAGRGYGLYNLPPVHGQGAANFVEGSGRLDVAKPHTRAGRKMSVADFFRHICGCETGRWNSDKLLLGPWSVEQLKCVAGKEGQNFSSVDEWWEGAREAFVESVHEDILAEAAARCERSGEGLDEYRREIAASKLQVAIYGEVVNRHPGVCVDYEGEVREIGDVVVMRHDPFDGEGLVRLEADDICGLTYGRMEKGEGAAVKWLVDRMDRDHAGEWKYFVCRVFHRPVLGHFDVIYGVGLDLGSSDRLDHGDLARRMVIPDFDTSGVLGKVEASKDPVESLEGFLKTIEQMEGEAGV